MKRTKRKELSFGIKSVLFEFVSPLTTKSLQARIMPVSFNLLFIESKLHKNKTEI